MAMPLVPSYNTKRVRRLDDLAGTLLPVHIA